MKLYNELRTADFISYKYFQKNYKLLIFLTVILSFSFVNIVFFTSFNKGLEETVNNELRTYVLGDIIIEPEGGDEVTKGQGGEEIIENADEIVSKIRALPGIAGVSKRLGLRATIAKKGKLGIGRLIAIIPEEDYPVSSLEPTIFEGSSIGRYEKNGVLMGVESAGFPWSRTLTQGTGISVKVGDEVEITFDSQFKKNYTVMGMFDTRYFESDFFTLINEKEIPESLGLKNKATSLMITVDDRSKLQEYKRDILNLGMHVKVSIWDEKAGFGQQVAKSLGVIQIVMFVAGIVIASVTIFITIYVNILNRMKFIGIMRAIGISRFAIIVSYLIETLFYCVAGIFVGLGITLAIIRYLTIQPLDLPLGLVTPVATTSNIVFGSLSIVIASLISAFIPTYIVTGKNIIYTIYRGEK
ncbi:MAG: FtsX-like permease family protein [Nanoarchaeota archaeon]